MSSYKVGIKEMISWGVSKKDLSVQAIFEAANDIFIVSMSRKEFETFYRDYCSHTLTVAKEREMMVDDDIIRFGIDDVVGMGVDHIEGFVTIQLERDGQRYDLNVPVEDIERGFSKANQDLIKTFIKGDD